MSNLPATTTPFHEQEEAAGAVFTEEAGWLVPAHFGDSVAEYHKTRALASFFDISQHGKIEVTGRDARAFLHNLTTNDIAALAPGVGREAFLANAKARAVAHVIVECVQLPEGPAAFWLETAPGFAGKVIQHLDHYRISEEVEFVERTRDFAQLHLAGPQALSCLDRNFLGVPAVGELHHVKSFFAPGVPLHVRRHDRLNLPGYDVLCPPGGAGMIWTALDAAGAAPAGQQAYHILRVEAGTPVYGLDIDENNMVVEVGRTERAISYTKGCYLGQEPIVRSRDLGHVNWTLRGLKMSGEGVVAAGTKMIRDGAEVGRVASSADSPRMGIIALAYIRRGQSEPGTKLELPGAGGPRTAEVVALPF